MFFFSLLKIATLVVCNNFRKGACMIMDTSELEHGESRGDIAVRPQRSHSISNTVRGRLDVRTMVDRLINHGLTDCLEALDRNDGLR